jgi:ABC-type amino acid transport substrate-binding protein
MTRATAPAARRPAVLAAAVAALLLGACAGGDTPSAELTTSAVPKEAAAQSAPAVPPPGKALLRFTRPNSLVYAGAPATVKVNGTKITDLWVGTTATTVADPGKLVIAVDTWSYPGDYKITVDVVAGQSVDLEVGPRGDSVATSVLLGPIGGAIAAANSENTGAFEVKVSGAPGAVAAVAAGAATPTENAAVPPPHPSMPIPATTAPAKSTAVKPPAKTVKPKAARAG